MKRLYNPYKSMLVGINSLSGLSVPVAYGLAYNKPTQGAAVGIVGLIGGAATSMFLTSSRDLE